MSARIAQGDALRIHERGPWHGPYGPPKHPGETGTVLAVYYDKIGALIEAQVVFLDGGRELFCPGEFEHLSER